jgi:hypothetical protein
MDASEIAGLEVGVVEEAVGELVEKEEFELSGVLNDELAEAGSGEDVNEL